MTTGWKTATVRSVTRQIYLQSHSDSCAIACIAMAINRVNGSCPTERAIMNAVTAGGVARRPVQGYIPAKEDINGSEDPLVCPTEWEKPYVGTYDDAIPRYLKAYRIRSSRPGTAANQLVSHCENCGTEPVIAQIDVCGRAGKHFVMFDGFVPPSTKTKIAWELVICDPLKGLGVAVVNSYFWGPRSNEREPITATFQDHSTCRFMPVSVVRVFR